jgi:hypothetical protein
MIPVTQFQPPIWAQVQVFSAFVEGRTCQSEEDPPHQRHPQRFAASGLRISTNPRHFQSEINDFSFSTAHAPQRAG